MCRLWARIRYGVQWNRKEQTQLAVKAMNFKDVKSVDISMDPLYSDNRALREFWQKITTQKVRETNPRMRIKAEIRNDDCLIAENGKKLLFKTEGFHIADLILRLNKLMGNIGQAPRGETFEEEEDIRDYQIEDRIRKLQRKKKPSDFLS